MAENLYHKLLSVHPEILNPDYYQLLLLEPDEAEPAQIEKQYKAQMSKVQNVRSTKYKDFVEFLKGELKQARRILNDPKLRSKYDNERKAEALEKLREIVTMFIQISGDLSEIEIGEIHRRGKYLNLNKKDIDKLIDEELKSLGCKRTKASVEQLRRASEILKRRAEQGELSEAGKMMQSILDNAQRVDAVLKQTEQTAARVASERKAKADKRISERKEQPEELRKEVEKLKKLAERKEKYKGLVKSWKIVNFVFNVLGWLLVIALLVLLLFLKDTPAVQDAVSSAFNIQRLSPDELVYKNRKVELKINKPASLPAPETHIEKTKSKFIVNVNIKEPIPTPIDKIKTLIVNAEQSANFAEKIEKARIEFYVYYEKLAEQKEAAKSRDKKLEIEKKIAEALKFYKSVLSPMFYTTRRVWDWQMLDRPLEFVSANVRFSQTFAEIRTQEKDFFLDFGGAFLTGKISISGFFTDKNNAGTFGIAYNRGSKKLSELLKFDPKFKLVKFDTLWTTVNGKRKTRETRKDLAGIANIKNFTLTLEIKSTIDDANKIEFFASIIAKSPNSSKTVRQNLYAGPFPFKIDAGRQLALYLAPNSAVRIRRIIVEPYN